MDQFFSTYSPKARVTIKDLATGDTKAEWGDVSNDVMSLSTNKAYGRCSGTWQMMLSYRMVQGEKRYHELIAPCDMITIEIDAGSGEGYLPVMLGLVDRVSAPRTIDNQGRPLRQIKLSGQDMGKLLNEHDIGWDIQKEKMEMVTTQQLDDGPPQIKPMKAISRLWDPSYQKGTPQEFVQNLYKLTFADVVSSSKYYALVSDTDDTWMRHMPLFGSLEKRKLWEAMKEVEHSPYNMLHCDTESTNLFLILFEKQPFNAQGRLERIPSKWHTLHDSEIIADDVGVCDAERINFLFFNPTLYQTSLDLSQDILIVHPEMTNHDPESIKKNGYRPKPISDNFLPPSMTNVNQDATHDALNDAKRLSDLYWEWNRHNHTFAAGSSQVHLRPDIKAGHGLLRPQPDGTQTEYLIEQVSHQCAWGVRPTFTTTLHVTRGQKHA